MGRGGFAISDGKRRVVCCMQDTFARATHSARPSARATIGYLVYKVVCETSDVLKLLKN